MSEQPSLSAGPVRRDPGERRDVTAPGPRAARARRFDLLHRLCAGLAALCSELSAAVLVDAKGKK